MLRSFREKFSDFFLSDETVLNEHCSVYEIGQQFPLAFQLIERKYGINVSSADLTLTLREFSETYALPPAPVLLAEIQLSAHGIELGEISPTEAEKLLHSDPALRILDVREDWERKQGMLPGAQPLEPALLDEILNKWPKETPVLIYCHFGVRSADAGRFLKDRGFTKVYCLRGGIDAWSLQVDPSLPRYDGQYC